jgi:hypothetical protein
VFGAPAGLVERVARPVGGTELGCRLGPVWRAVSAELATRTKSLARSDCLLLYAECRTS